jgi:hypothetical protein
MGLAEDVMSRKVPVIADERDHMQAAMQLMRDVFFEACQSGIPWEKAGELQGQFFDGYSAAKRAWGDALLKRDVLGTQQRDLDQATPADLVAQYIETMKQAEEAARRSVLDGTISCQICRALVLQGNADGHYQWHRDIGIASIL